MSATGKSTGSSTGKDKLAALRAKEAREARQKKLLAVVAGLVVVVLAVVAVMWAVSANNQKKDRQAADQAAKAGAFISKVEHIPADVVDQVGFGTVSNPPIQLKGAKPLTQDGKPRFIFYGAEYCPYCAMERWAVVAALSRFGTWSGLQGTVSSEANIPTMDFLKAKFTSKYIDFTGYEMSDQQDKPLQTPPAADLALFQKYDTPEYFTNMQQGGSIPFMIFGGTAASSGSTYDASQTMSGMTADAVAAKLTNPADPVTKGIVGAANVITAQLCQSTKGLPSDACSSAGVMKTIAQLGQVGGGRG